MIDIYMLSYYYSDMRTCILISLKSHFTFKRVDLIESWVWVDTIGFRGFILYDIGWVW